MEEKGRLEEETNDRGKANFKERGSSKDKGGKLRQKARKRRQVQREGNRRGRIIREAEVEGRR